MGSSFLKIPNIHLFSSNAESSASGLLAKAPRKLMTIKKQPIEIVPPPEWVEQIDGYFVSSCKWHDYRSCIVVEYVPNDRSVSWDGGFVKIYATDDLNGTPFAHMKEIWKDIHDDKKVHSITYDITEDGRIYNDNGEFPSDDNIKDAIYDIGSIYDDWKNFPNVQDWNVVCKLRDAKFAVDRMRVEAKYGNEQENIDSLRKKIKEIQTQIAKAEKNLNEMYEKAADGMNLLEQYGIVVNLDDEPKQPEKPVADHDMSSLYPNGFLKYIGEATIMRLYDGSYDVIPNGLNHNPVDGDMVHDTRNGLIAVYSLGKWVVVNP